MAMVDADWEVTRSSGNIRYIGDDHTLDGGTPSYATVIQFHRWLQNLADDPAFSGDDQIDIVSQNPSDNGFNIDAEAAEHLYDGSIIQNVGTETTERWDGIVNFGQANAHIQIHQNGAVLTDDFWNFGYEEGDHTPAGSSATVMTDTGKTWTTDEWVGYTIVNKTDSPNCRGIITANTADTITVAELYGGTNNEWQQNDNYHIAKPLNGDAGQGISHRFMIKTVDNGVDIDRRRLIGTTRRWGNTYAEFKINGTSQGNNVLALSDGNDLNNNSTYASVSGIATITNTEGLQLIDIDNNSVDEEYYSKWVRGAASINDFYEYQKYRSTDSTDGAVLNSLNGELFRGITHSYAYDNETGTQFTTNAEGVWGTAIAFNGGTGTATIGEYVFEDTATPVWGGRVLGGDLTGATGTIIVDVQFGTVTDTDTFVTGSAGLDAAVNGTPTAQVGNSAGRGIIYAIDDDGTEGNMYMQVLRGVAPVDNTRIFLITDPARYHDVNATITERSISTPFVGQSTGSALIGSYGLGMDTAAVAAADTFFDLSNTAINPPNTVQFTVSGFVDGDYVLCTEADGNDINFDQMALNATYNTGGITTISVNAIPSDTPAGPVTKGGIRIQRDNGLYSLHRYTAFDTGTDDFTIPSTDFSTNNATTGNFVFVSYIDGTANTEVGETTDTFSYVYSSDRTHFLRVRNGGTPIKDAFATGDMTNTGGSAAVNTVSDA
jgi:hypothetical protein